MEMTTGLVLLLMLPNWIVLLLLMTSDRVALRFSKWLTSLGVIQGLSGFLLFELAVLAISNELTLSDPFARSLVMYPSLLILYKLLFPITTSQFSLILCGRNRFAVHLPNTKVSGNPVEEFRPVIVGLRALFRDFKIKGITIEFLSSIFLDWPESKLTKHAIGWAKEMKGTGTSIGRTKIRGVSMMAIIWRKITSKELTDGQKTMEGKGFQIEI